MHQLYQDAMTIVTQLGKPDLFFTITCNPKVPLMMAGVIIPSIFILTKSADKSAFLIN